MQGVFNGTASKTGTTNGRQWTVYNVNINGQSYGLGYTTQLTQGINPGDTVEFTVKENPKRAGFFNIETLTKAIPAPVATNTQTGSGALKSGVDYSSVDRRAALEVAANLVVARFNHPAAKQVKSLVDYLKETVALADHFTRFIQTGVVEVLKPEEVKKVEEAVAEPDVNDLVG